MLRLHAPSSTYCRQQHTLRRERAAVQSAHRRGSACGASQGSAAFRRSCGFKRWVSRTGRVACSADTQAAGEPDEPDSYDLSEFPAEDISQALLELKSQCGEKVEQIDESVVTWFLRAYNLNVEKAVSKLQAYQEWRKSGYQSVEEESIADEIASGKAIIHPAPDLQGRPIVIVKASLQKVSERDLESSKRLCVYLMDNAVRQLEAPGSSCETLLSIWDLRGFSFDNADIPFLKFFVDCMFYYYPKRISQVLLVDAPFVFKPVWQVIKPLLGKYSGIVRFVSLEEVKEYTGRPVL